ncbi:amidohydrolase family protein [Nocardioides sp.]|uniref:amidohydrolase family protein n=1 Tax=Nocardioides sp. TaxID=35761 RepID=UPI0025E0B7F7|nr:amidohydrolase family protein [Nocardioides sp.]
MRSAESVDLVLRDVTVPDVERGTDSPRVDVAVRGGRIVAVEPRTSLTASQEYDGRGAALLPGLHDHHLHLLATAALAGSVDCSDVSSLVELGDLLRAAAPTSGWLRAVGHHESRVGRLTRDVLDDLLGPGLAGTPVRVRDHSGALWVLNSAGLDLLGDLSQSTGVERDAAGRSTGRLWRLDRELGVRLGTVAPDLAALGEHLADLGISGVTDATPDLSGETVALLDSARRTGRLPQRVMLLGTPDGTGLPASLSTGPAKIHLRDHDLPSVDDLSSAVAAHHGAGRAVAVHCLGSDALVLTLSALETAGPLPGDRIEHASVVPPVLLPRIREAGVAVVTQPGFVSVRGDDLLRDIEGVEREWLWPWAGLDAVGVPVCGASDAPHGPLSPWEVIAAASTRRTPSGRVVAGHEQVTPLRALRGYLTAPEQPGGQLRRVEPGAHADLVLLRSGLEEALASVPVNPVRLTVLGGRVSRSGRDRRRSLPLVVRCW